MPNPVTEAAICSLKFDRLPVAGRAGFGKQAAGESATLCQLEQSILPNVVPPKPLDRLMKGDLRFHPAIGFAYFQPLWMRQSNAFYLIIHCHGIALAGAFNDQHINKQFCHQMQPATDICTSGKLSFGEYHGQQSCNHCSLTGALG